jgi:hypothetical protein
MRAYLVTGGGTVELIDIPKIDGKPHTNGGYPMEPTDDVRELVGWPDTVVRVWKEGPNTYLVPENRLSIASENDQRSNRKFNPKKISEKYPILISLLIRSI